MLITPLIVSYGARGRFVIKRKKNLRYNQDANTRQKEQKSPRDFNRFMFLLKMCILNSIESLNEQHECHLNREDDAINKSFLMSWGGRKGGNQNFFSCAATQDETEMCTDLQ